MTVVIDCNILVICLTSRSPYHLVYQQLVKGKFNLVVTGEIMLEYEEILQNKYSETAARAFMTLLSELPNVFFINRYYKWQLINADPDDNKYIDCAITGQADCIVTEDKHFDVLKKISFPSVNVLGIEKFVNILQAESTDL